MPASCKLSSISEASVLCENAPHILLIISLKMASSLELTNCRGSLLALNSFDLCSRLAGFGKPVWHDAVVLRPDKPCMVAHLLLLCVALLCCTLVCCALLLQTFAILLPALTLPLASLALAARMLRELMLGAFLLCCKPLGESLSGGMLLCCALLSGCLLDGAVDCRSLGNAEERSHVLHSLS